MTTDSIIKQIAMQTPQGLAAVYEGICEVYRKRLCEQWDIDIRDTFWVADRIGEVLCVNDIEFSFGMEELRGIVDMAITYEDYSEFFKYNIDAYNYATHPINFHSWFRLGARPKDLKE